MGTNINHEELLKERNGAVDNILHNFKSWDGEMETGLELIKENGVEIDRIDTLNLQLSRYPAAQSEDYRSKIEEIIEEQKKLQATIKEQQTSLLKNMQQLNKRQDVIKNYISKEKSSIFIDKDVR